MRGSDVCPAEPTRSLRDVLPLGFVRPIESIWSMPITVKVDLPSLTG